jgi:hypothetical protein
MSIIGIVAQPTYAIGHAQHGMLLGYENGEPIWSGKKPVDIYDALEFKSVYEANNFIAIYLEYWAEENAKNIVVWRVLPKPRCLNIVPLSNSPKNWRSSNREQRERL